jgi:hypothetical protein
LCTTPCKKTENHTHPLDCEIQKTQLIQVIAEWLKTLDYNWLLLQKDYFFITTLLYTAGNIVPAK